MKVESHPVFQQHQGIPPIPPKVFHQLDSHHQRSDMEYSGNFMCAGYAVLGLLSVSVLLNVQTGEAMELCGIFLTLSVF